MNAIVNVYLKDDFIIYYVIWVFFQSLPEYITFQTALKTYDMIAKVVLENKHTFNSWQEFFTPLTASYSLTIRTWFNDCRSSTASLSTSNIIFKVDNILKKEL